MNPADLYSAYYRHGHTADWLVHALGNALIHALIYGLVFRLMRHLTLGQAALLVGGVIVVLFLWARARDSRRW